MTLPYRHAMSKERPCHVRMGSSTLTECFVLNCKPIGIYARSLINTFDVFILLMLSFRHIMSTQRCINIDAKSGWCTEKVIRQMFMTW